MSAKQKQVNSAFEQVIQQQRDIDEQNAYINELATQVIELQAEKQKLKTAKKPKKQGTINGGSE